MEALVKQVKADWIGDDGVNDVVLRRLMGSIKLTKGMTKFDGEGSSCSHNSQSAEFDVAFTVGDNAEGYFNGEVVNREGEHTGRIESNFFLIEDDLDDTKADWSEEMMGMLKDDAEKWQSAAGLTEEDMPWQTVSKVVAGVVCALVDKCEYNQDDWVWDYVTERMQTEVARLPDSGCKRRKVGNE